MIGADGRIRVRLNFPKGDAINQDLTRLNDNDVEIHSRLIFLIRLGLTTENAIQNAKTIMPIHSNAIDHPHHVAPAATAATAQENPVRINQQNTASEVLPKTSTRKALSIRGI